MAKAKIVSFNKTNIFWEKNGENYVSGGLGRNDKIYENRDPAFITGSPIMTDLIRKIILVVKTDTTLLLTGEYGTGKEVLARLVHSYSARNREPFVTGNCGAIPADIVERELFGHEKGAFIGAIDRKLGCFELSHKGILFLDEMGDMPYSAPVKLLRAYVSCMLFWFDHVLNRRLLPFQRQQVCQLQPAKMKLMLLAARA